MSDEPQEDRDAEYRCVECGRITDASCRCALCSYPEDRINDYGQY